MSGGYVMFLEKRLSFCISCRCFSLFPCYPSLAWPLRLIVMRSDAELQIFMFRPEEIIGLAMQSDSANSTGQNLI